MMHNDKDPWVPWHLGMELFMALYRLNRPVWLVNYNGERHWPTKLAHRKDWTIRMEQFFNHYLKGASASTWLKEGIPALQKGKTLGLE
jgi:dipeptidyl aminopeptidase/acylaminoacyl peptidase